MKQITRPGHPVLKFCANPACGESSPRHFHHDASRSDKLAQYCLACRKARRLTARQNRLAAILASSIGSPVTTPLNNNKRRRYLKGAAKVRAAQDLKDRIEKRKERKRA
jgi:hypothetical protein